MALTHDAQGFLIGDRIDLRGEVEHWKRIRDDVRAIRSGVSKIAEAVLGIKADAPTGQARPVVPVSISGSPVGGERAPGAPGGDGEDAGALRIAVPSARSAPQQIPVLLRPASTPSASDTGKVDGESRTVAGQAVAAIRASQKAVQQTVAKPMNRDTRGRFLSRTERSPVGGERAPGAPGGDGEDAGALRGVADRIAGAIKESGNGMEEADPTIKAFNEVARPMARGYELLTGGDKQKRQEGWLRRIYTSLTGFRKEETAFNKAANKSLKAIEEKPVAEAVGGGGIFGTLISMLKGVGPAIVAAIGGLLGKLGGGFGGLAKSAGGMLKGAGGFLKRLPLLGSLLSIFGAASDIADSEGDDTLSRREKDRRAGKAIGGAGGAVGGMMAGAALGSFLGPVGTLIGGAVGAFLGDQAGQIIGDKLGGWVNDLRSAEIPGMIASAWEATTGAIKSGWDATTEFLKSGWDGALDKLSHGWNGVKDGVGQASQLVTDKANATNNFIKDKTGVDIKAGAVAAKDKAVELGGKVVDAAQTGAVALKDTAVHAGSDAMDWAAKNTTVGKTVSTVYQDAKAIGRKVGENWNDAKLYLLGASDKAGVDAGTVAKIANFESGFNADAAPIRKDGTRISSAHGYGQFIDGTWTDMLNKYGSKYGVEGAGKLTKEQAAKFRDDKSIQAAMLAEFTRENVEKGRKYGGVDDDANVYAFHNLGDKDAKNLLTGMKQNPAMTVREALLQTATTDKERARVETVIAGNKSLYGDGSVTAADAYARLGQVMRRGDAFAADARHTQQAGSTPAAAKIQTAAAQSVTPATPQVPAPVSYTAPKMPAIVASANIPSLPAMPSTPPVSEAPPITVPLAASGGSDRPIQVSIPSPDVGQDIRDRQLAHIVTGGFSA